MSRRQWGHGYWRGLERGVALQAKSSEAYWHAFWAHGAWWYLKHPFVACLLIYKKLRGRLAPAADRDSPDPFEAGTTPPLKADRAREGKFN